MSRINRKLLKKAKNQLRSAAKSGDETAESILSRKKNRKTERFADNTRKDTVKAVSWNFFPGELVCFKNAVAWRYGCNATDCYIVIGTSNTEGYNIEESNSRLEIVGPGGLLVADAAHVKKVS